MKRVAALSIALAAALGPGHARGDRDSDRTPGALRDRSHQYQVVIADGWSAVAVPAGTLAAYQASGGRGHMAITRVAVGARRREPEELVAEVERGVAGATRGYQRVRRKLGQSGSVPTLDLWYEQQRASGPGLTLARFLFFNRHSVVLSIGLERGASRRERRAAEAMLKSFRPLEAR
jgi:hypothetical protein